MEVVAIPEGKVKSKSAVNLRDDRTNAEVTSSVLSSRTSSYEKARKRNRAHVRSRCINRTMATATMGLRRRVPVNNSPTPSGHSSSNVSASSKRSRSENNNSPSQGNLNSVNGSREEPPTKKSRGTTTNSGKNNASPTSSASNTSGVVSLAETNSSSKSRGSSLSRSNNQTKISSNSNNSNINGDHASNVPASSWSTTSNMSDVPTYASVAGLGMTNGQSSGLCASNLGMTTPIPPYMSTSMATFVGNATNLGKSSSVSYLDISNMTSGSLGSSNATNSLASGYGTNKTTGTNLDSNSSGVKTMAFPGISSANVNANGYGSAQQKGQSQTTDSVALPKKFQNDGMFNAYQPWVIKTYGDLAKTKTITIKKYARILRTLRGEEVNSAENSKFRFWVKSKGFHIGQPEGYDAKPADRIVGRHAVTNPGLDPPLYVPTQLPHNKVST